MVDMLTHLRSEIGEDVVGLDLPLAGDCCSEDLAVHGGGGLQIEVDVGQAEQNLSDGVSLEVVEVGVHLIEIELGELKIFDQLADQLGDQQKLLVAGLVVVEAQELVGVGAQILDDQLKKGFLVCHRSYLLISLLKSLILPGTEDQHRGDLHAHGL